MKKIIFLLLLFSYEGHSQSEFECLSINSLSLDSLFLESSINNIGDLLNGKRIIAVGEATHGTSEFFNFKADLFKNLVTQQGVRVLALEAPFTRTDEINQYVNSVEGIKLHEAVYDLGVFIYYTEEFSKLIDWIRLYNNENESKILIQGFTTSWPTLPLDNLRAWLKTKDRNDLLSSLKSYDLYAKREKSKLSKGELLEIEEALNAIEKLIVKFNDVNKNELLQSVKALHQFVESLNSSSREAPDLRDRFSFENIKWIVNNTTSNVFVWAHNAHIAKIEGDGFLPMGYHLNEYFGESYFAISTSFDNGSFRAYDTRERMFMNFDWNKGKEMGYDDFFSKNTIPNFYLNFNSLKETDCYIFLQTPNESVSIGQNYSYKGFQSYSRHHKIMDSYDAVAFFRKTSPTSQLKK